MSNTNLHLASKLFRYQALKPALRLKNEHEQSFFNYSIECWIELKCYWLH